MAAELDYRVPPAPMPGARAEWEDLLATLHRSGTLRVLRGFFGQLGAVSDVALGDLNQTAGRDLIGSVLFLAECASKVPAKELTAVVSGMAEGMHEAKTILAEERPPSTFAIFRLLREPETRRAVGAGLMFLNRIGAHVSDDVMTAAKGPPIERA